MTANLWDFLRPGGCKNHLIYLVFRHALNIVANSTSPKYIPLRYIRSLLLMVDPQSSATQMLPMEVRYRAGQAEKNIKMFLVKHYDLICFYLISIDLSMIYIHLSIHPSTDLSTYPSLHLSMSAYLRISVFMNYFIYIYNITIVYYSYVLVYLWMNLCM